MGFLCAKIRKGGLGDSEVGPYSWSSSYVEDFTRRVGVVLLSGAPTGSFTVGETLTFSGGGSGVLAQDKSGESIRRLIIKLGTTSPEFSGTITGETSSATATVSSFEGFESYSEYGFRPNRIIKFLGDTYLLCYSTVFRFDKTNDYWVEAFRHITPTNSDWAGRKSGLHTVTISGTPHLVFLYSKNSDGIYRVKFDGSTWSQSQITSGYISSHNSGPGLGSIVYHNTVHLWGACNGNFSYVWNPLTDDFSTTSAPSEFTSDQAATDFCVFKDALYCVGFNRLDYSDRKPYLARFDGSVWSKLGAVDSYSLDAASADNRCCLFVGQNGYMYVVYLRKNGSGSGFCCQKLDLSSGSVVFSSKDIVMPPELRYPDVAYGFDSSCLCYVDGETGVDVSDDANPVIVLMIVGGTNAGSCTTLEFVDDATTMTFPELRAGFSAIGSVPNDKGPGGSRNYAIDVPSCVIVGNPTPVSGGERWTVQIKSPPSGAVSGLKFRALFRLSGDSSTAGVPRKWGYLTNPSAGSLSVGNRELTGLTSGTTFTVDWLAASQDGLAHLSRVIRMPVIYT